MNLTTALLSIALVLPQAGPTPELREIDAVELLELVRRAEASVVLVNVWATWCLPCHEELPALVRLREEWREGGFELILVSADFPSDVDDVREFLGRHGVDFRTYLKVGDDMVFVETLEPDWSGRLPASFVFDARGRLRDFWEGPASPELLRQKVVDVIGEPSRE